MERHLGPGQTAGPKESSPTLMVSIVVLTKNEEANIQGCLDMIFSQHFEHAFEVLVIDSGSTDSTTSMATRFPVKLIEIEPQEFSHGGTRNLGAEMGNGQIIVFLNGDAQPADQHWLSTLVQALAPENVVGAYSRQLPRSYAYPMEQFFLNWMYPCNRVSQGKANAANQSFDSTFFSTVSAAVRKRVFQDAPFRADIPMSEDNEWSVRVARQGFRIAYCPDSLVYHSHNYTLRHAFRRFFDAGMTARMSYLDGNRRNWVRVASKGIGYIWGEQWHLLRTGKFYWLPYALIYDGCKFTGYALGLVSRLFPHPFRNKLSANLKAHSS